MPYDGRGSRQRIEFRRHVRELRATAAQPQSWLTFVVCGVCIVLIMLIAIAAHPTWKQRTARVKASAERRREVRKEAAFRREIMRGLQARLSAEEIAQIREQARPVTAVKHTVYVDRDMAPSEYDRAIRWGQWEGEQKAKKQEQENRVRWAMVAALHGLSKTEMTVLCGPQP